MLKLLTEHFQQPVLPMRRFCAAISQWFRCIEELNTDPEEEKQWCQGNEYWMHLRKIETDIQKSNLLYRLLYVGEKFRTEKCPAHKGHLTFAQEQVEGCTCDGTGWVPQE
jgi:hypothetical protein